MSPWIQGDSVLDRMNIEFDIRTIHILVYNNSNIAMIAIVILVYI